MEVMLLSVGWGVLAGTITHNIFLRRLSRVPKYQNRWAKDLVLKVTSSACIRSVSTVICSLVGSFRKKNEFRLEVASTVDLLRVAIGSGHTPYVAVKAILPFVSSHISSALRRVMKICDSGLPFTEAVMLEAEHTIYLSELAEQLVSCARLGTPLEVGLKVMSGELRDEMRRDAETRARKVSVKLIFPLVFLVLPAFAFLTVVPAIVSGLQQLN